jgi:hypothetical protein
MDETVEDTPVNGQLIAELPSPDEKGRPEAPARSVLPRVPAAAVPRLLELSSAAAGAESAAAAAVAVARERRGQFESEFSTVLRVLGLSVQVNWRIDFDTGELSMVQGGQPGAGQMPPPQGP